MAVANVRGGELKVLTWDSDVSITDMCPTLLPGAPDALVFTRSTNQGMSTFPAILNLTTSALTLHETWPQIGEGSGCPAALGARSFMYLGCAKPPCGVARSPAEELASPQRWGVPAGSRVTSGRAGSGFKSGWAQLKVELGGAPTTLFDVALTKAPSYVGVFVTSQCDRVWATPDAPPPANDSIICQGADPTHLTLLKEFVDVRSGKSARNDTSTLRRVMTPRPYALRRARMQ